jgi:hypothetical protein
MSAMGPSSTHDNAGRNDREIALANGLGKSERNGERSPVK